MTFLHVVGTSHVARQAKHDITAAYDKYKPDIMGVELDRQRFLALKQGVKPNYSVSLIKYVGVQGYLFAIIGSFLQRHIGSIVGIQPGAEMLHATKLATQYKKQLAFIDQPLTTTLRRISKQIPFSEKTRMALDVIKGVLFRKGPKIKINLHKTPKKELVIILLQIMKQQYPHLYNVLVTERNKYMARQIHNLHHTHPNKTILVVVGAGHEPELAKEVALLERRRDYVTKPI